MVDSWLVALEAWLRTIGPIISERLALALLLLAALAVGTIRRLNCYPEGKS